MSNVIDFKRPQTPGPEAPQSPGDWLRELAARMDGEASDSVMKPPQMVLVIVNHDKDSTAYRLRAERHDCSKLTAVGMLHTAAHDYNADG